MTTAFEGPARLMSPAVASELPAMVAQLPDDLRGTRDRARLRVGFAAAQRREGLVALDGPTWPKLARGWSSRCAGPDDPEGAGRKIGVPYGPHPATCPVRALRAWIELWGIVKGPLLVTIDRSGRLGYSRATVRSVARAVQRAAQPAGPDPARYAGPPSGPATLATAA